MLPSLNSLIARTVAIGLVFACSVPVTMAEEPKGYMVGLVQVMNKDWVDEYRKKNAKILQRHGGKILVRDKPVEALEGMAPEVDAILVVEFPSVEAARAWYRDPDYQPLIELRQSGARVDFLLLRQLTD